MEETFVEGLLTTTPLAGIEYFDRYLASVLFAAKSARAYLILLVRCCFVHLLLLSFSSLNSRIL